MGTVLVVEDEATVREVVCAYLHRAGLPTHEAADGLVAVRAFPDVRPDLVVLDLMIPGIDGFEVLRRCDLASVSGVVLTGGNVDPSRYAQLLGVDDGSARDPSSKTGKTGSAWYNRSNCSSTDER